MKDDQQVDFFDDEEELVALEPVVSFMITDQKYALPMGVIKEVIKCPDITKIPQLPDHLPGLVNVRGNVYVVADLSILFGLSQSSKGFDYLLILELDNYAVALGVASVPDTIHINMDEIQAGQNQLIDSSAGHNYIHGFLKYEDELITFLSIDKLVSSKEFSK